MAAMRKILCSLVLLAGLCFGEGSDNACEGYEVGAEKMQSVLVKWAPLKSNKYTSREKIKEAWKIEKTNMEALEWALKKGKISLIQELHRDIKLDEYHVNPVNLLILTNIFARNDKESPAFDEFFKLFITAIDRFITKYDLGVTTSCAAYVLIDNMVELRKMQKDTDLLFLKPFF